MASRSTRTKLKDQGGKIKLDIERIYEHLEYMDALACGRSVHITTHMPLLLGVMKEVELIMYAFIDEI